MKISDRELREIAANKNDEGAPVCAELLQRRREVRRLRAALRPFVDAWRVLQHDKSVGLSDEMYVRVIPEGTATIRRSDCVRAYCALKPQRGAK